MKYIYSYIIIFIFLSSDVFAQGWSKINNDSGISQLFMVDNQIGYATSYGANKLKTTDGGKTWVTMEMPYNPNNPQLHLLFNSLVPQALYFFNQNEGYIAGINQNYAMVAKTSDGGVTWSIPYLEVRDNDAGYTNFYFSSPTQGLMIGEKGKIIKTTDGVNWQKVPSPTTVDLNQIVFSSQQEGYIFGEYVRLKTIDGGTTWTSESLEYNLSKVVAPSANKWYAINSAQIYTSQDQGKSWQEYHYSFPHYYRDIHFFNENEGIVSGSYYDGSEVFYTSNGGKNWEPLSYDFGPMLGDIHFVSNELGFVVSSSKIYQMQQNIGTIVPVPIFNYQEGPLCEKSNLPVIFSNTSNPAHSYEWWVDDVKQSEDYDFSYFFSEPGDHQIMLKAINSTSRDSVIQSFTINPLPTFSVPLNVSIDIQGDSTHIDKEITFTISQHHYSSTYHIELNGDTVAGPKRGIKELTFSTPSSGGSYTYQVIEKATNSCGSVYQTLDTTIQVLDVPYAPVNLLMTRLPNRSVQLEWVDQSWREEGYIIERSLTDNVQFQEIGRTGEAINSAIFLDTGLVTSNQYIYRVKAFNQFGTSKPSNSATVYVHDKVIYVKQGAEDGNLGTSWDDAFNSLDRAIEESVSENEIWITEGTYYPAKVGGFNLKTEKAKAIYGGFVGSEDNIDQRKWREHKTILSGKPNPDISSPVSFNSILTLYGKIADGLVVENGRTKGIYALGNSIIENCLVQNNYIGIELKPGNTRVNSCIIRNQKTDLPWINLKDIHPRGSGIVVSGGNYRERIEISNSYIYNNDGLGIYFHDRIGDIYNCTLYANKTSGIGSYFPHSNPTYFNTIQVYNSVFGYRPEDGSAFVASRSSEGINIHPHSCISGYINYQDQRGIKMLYGGSYNLDLSFMAGNDEELGTDDDIFFFSDNSMLDKGEESDKSIKDYHKDYYNRQRIVGPSIDRGSIEVQDSILLTLPQLTAEAISERKIRVSWDTPHSSIYKYVILEKKIDSFYEIQNRVPISDGEYVDDNLLGNQSYTYRIRLQGDTLVTVASNAITAITKSYLDTLYANNIKANSVNIEWGNSHPDIQKFYVSRKGEGQNNFSTLDTLNAESKNYYDTTLLAGTTYTYRLKTVINDSIFQYNTIDVNTNHLPVINDIELSAYETDTVLLTNSLFTNVYDDHDNEPLKAITLLLTDNSFEVYIDEDKIALPHEVSISEIDRLSVIPLIGAPDTIQVNFNATDGKDYAAVPAKINIELVKPNQPPLLSDILISTVPGESFRLHSELFDDAYNDFENDSIQKIQLVDWPGAISVVKNDSVFYPSVEIDYVDIENVSFSTSSDFTGKIEILYNAFDGTSFSDSSRRIQVEVLQKNNPPQVSEIILNANASDTIFLNEEIFASAFWDEDGDALSSVKLIHWPEELLVFDNDSLIMDEYIFLPSISDNLKLVYKDFLTEEIDTLQISYNASDSEFFASSLSNIKMIINPAFHAPEIEDIHINAEMRDTITLSKDLFLNAYFDKDGDSFTSIKLLDWDTNLLFFSSKQQILPPYEINEEDIEDLKIVANMADTFKINYTVSDGVQYAKSIKNILLYVEQETSDIIISGQQDISIAQGSSYSISLTDLILEYDSTLIDPNQFHISLIPDNNYTYDGLIIKPDSSFIGTLKVPIILINHEQEVSYTFHVIVEPVVEAIFSVLNNEIKVNDTLILENHSTDDADSYKWSFEGANKISSTSKVPTDIFYTEEGVYSITLTVIKSEKISVYQDSIHVLPSQEFVTGILDSLTPIKIYPNPASEEITIGLKTIWKYGIYSIHNSEGKLVDEGKIHTIPLLLNVSHYPSGKYYLTLKNNNSMEVLHFLIID